MRKTSDQIRVAILRALEEIGAPAGAVRIYQRLMANGVKAQPRTIRYHLMQLDRDGLTRFVARRHGREITARGREELAHTNVVQKLGFVATRIDELVYQMDFNLERREGSIVANIATISSHTVARALEDMRAVFARGWSMGSLIALARSGEMLGRFQVPEGMVGIATVCSVTVNGILLKQGIPVTSRYGGLLEIRDGRPERFVELIEYRGSTMDPLLAFIQAGMTRVRECARSGHAVIGASFREVPSVALEDLTRLRRKMQACGLGGLLALGYPNQPLLDIPVSEGRAGLVVVGGLNPMAAIREAGTPMQIHPLAGLVDYARFDTFERVRSRFPEV